MSETNETPTPEIPPPPATPPPAAIIVATGSESESTTAELARVRAHALKLERDNMELEDENRRLKYPEKPAVKKTKGFWDGWGTVLD